MSLRGGRQADEAIPTPTWQEIASAGARKNAPAIAMTDRRVCSQHTISYTATEIDDLPFLLADWVMI